LTVLNERRTKVNLRARFPTDRKPHTTRYDYEDNDDGDEVLDDEPAGDPQAVTEKSRDNILSFSKNRMR